MVDRLVKVYAGNHPVDAHLTRSRCVDRGFRVELLEPERSEGGMLGGPVEGYWLLLHEADAADVEALIATQAQLRSES
jgi:hypothetical protein